MIRETGFELLKLRVQKKNYVMIGGHLLFLGLCYLAFRSSENKLGSTFSRLKLEDASSYLDGMFFARIAMIPAFLVLMPIVIATLAGDCVAGEMQDGSLKLYVSRPRSRTKIILSKFLAVYIATLLYCLYFATVNVLIGTLLFGHSASQLVLLDHYRFGSEILIMPYGEALLRYLGSAVYFSFSLMALGSIALFLSTVFNRMTAATVTVISLHFISYVVGALPFSQEIKPYLLSEVMNNAFLLWLSPMPVQKLTLNLTALAIYIIGFLLLSILNFNCKDLK